MPHYMAEMVLEDKRVLMIGGGGVALRKLNGIAPCGACVTLIAPQLHPKLQELVDQGKITHKKTFFSPTHLQETPLPVLVFAATGDADLNRHISFLCDQKGLWCNSSDSGLGDGRVRGFLVPATVRRGPITVGVATAGCSPSLSRLLKERIEDWLESGWGGLALLFGKQRQQVKKRLPINTIRYTFWRNTSLAVVEEERFKLDDNTEWFEKRLEQQEILQSKTTR